MPVLNHEAVTNGYPQAWLYVLHGIFGAGRNWGSVIRRVVRVRPEWGALLIDLREHGRSKGFSPPHTVAAAAADLHELAGHTGIAPAAVLGHSFGGKVALRFARGAMADAALQSLRQVWVIDSTPAPRQRAGSAWKMLELVRQMPDHYASRDEAVDWIVGAGFSEPVAQWMATNLEQTSHVYRWRFNLDAMDEMLRSFDATDLWDVVESPPDDMEVHLVKGEESSVLSGDELQRAERAAANGRTFVHRVSGGHWVNAENPDAIEQLLVQRLPRE